jgi:hypothetical protein
MVFSFFSFSKPVSAVALNPLDNASVVVSGGNKIVTVSFNVYSTQVGTLADLKSKITVEKTGDAAFTDLGTDDTVTLSTTDTTSW